MAMIFVSSLNNGIEGRPNYAVKIGAQENSVNIAGYYTRRISGLKAIVNVIVLTLNRMISVSKHLDFL